ncbi:MAG: AAA family ATPase [Sphingomonadales bacterium]|nr:AAA family ATPase [Sphingomonadales bacterium]
MKDFRSIDGDVDISLDAPIVLIHGPNGAGKTSLLSAIELALTGAVPSLSRADPDYLSYLPHKNRPFGEVRLEMTADDGAVRNSILKVTTQAVTGSALLSENDARFFSERSYLAQSTLGRLLEIYQHVEKKGDSPLTRFVKELLGLDRMEALIGGLHTAGNIARLKAPVPAYGENREGISLDQAEVAGIDAQIQEAETALGTHEDLMRTKLAAVDPDLIGRPPADVVLALDAISEETELTTLVRARRELEVSQTGWNAAKQQEPPGSGRAEFEAANQRAAIALETWTLAEGQGASALLNRASGFFADVSTSIEASFSERARVLADRIDTDIERIWRVAATHDTAVGQRDTLARQLTEARSRLERLDSEVSSASTSNEAFAQSLSDLMTHVEGDVCPVCDRDFTEVSDTPLSAHVAGKIATMIEQAGRLQALLQSRTNAQSEVSRLDRDLQAATSGLISDTELTALKIRAADLTDVQSQLHEAASRFSNGDRYRREAAAAAQLLVASQTADQSAIVLRSNAEELAHRLGVEFEPAATTEQLLDNLRMAIAEQERSLTNRQTARLVAIDAAKLVTASRNTLSGLLAKRSEVETRLSFRTGQKAEADKIIDIAKDIARQTREARGRIVRHVFNDELNAVWRDLFVRLAPEEPFIPAFAIPETTTADVEAVLETHHRRGGKGGNPRAMLSAGNLNTAALTLFMALHLSVKRKLPWLVIDDPVQSMDEVHIAQFAALLRTLSKQMGRQVIIAVHERSLFDYLSLELSPAFPGDRLNVVELGRNAMGQTICRWDARLYVADKAIAA